MAPFNWLLIDGVHYQWDGEQIFCRGDFGYQTEIKGSQLNDIELEGEDGDVIGRISIDFATAQILFQPFANANSDHLSIQLGFNEQSESLSLTTLVAPNSVPLSLLEPERDIMIPDFIVESDVGERGIEDGTLCWEDFNFDNNDIFSSTNQTFEPIIIDLRLDPPIDPILAPPLL